ncbi:MAG: hypothetical protein WAT22_05920 [Saprospiraceae bacterium]
MRNRTILLILFIGSTFSTVVFGQTTVGDWYTPLRNKLLHITISKDSILFRKCSFDIEMRDYGYVDMAFKIEKSINSYFIVSGTKDTVPTFYLLKFKLENGRNLLNIESLNNKFPTLTDAENSIKLIEQQPMNVILMDKSTIDKIRQQKVITTMTSNDFKSYALKIIELDSINASYSQTKYKLSYLYIEATGRIILSELGFNSLVKGNLFNSMLEKFEENPETKEIFIKMTGSEK